MTVGYASRVDRRVAVALALLVLLALAVRVPGFSQGLYGDELYTYDDVDGRGFASMIDVVQASEDNPPLFYVLAWILAKLGDATFWVRVPSLLAALATVPMIYVLGKRIVDAKAGLAGALLFSVAPFAVFYGTEARAYSLVGLLVVVCAYAVIRASEGDGARWWVVAGAAAAASLYTHYTSLWVIATLGLWSFVTHAQQRRAAVLAFGAAALAVVPWVATGPRTKIEGFEVFFPFDFEHVVRAFPRAALGHPETGFADVPGKAALVVIGLGCAVAVWGLIQGELPKLDARLALLIALVIATPLGNAVYSAAVSSIFAPRNLYASVPFAWLAAGVLLSRAPQRTAAAATMIISGGLLLGSLAPYGDDTRRPAFKDAANDLDKTSGPVVVIDPFVETVGPYRGGHSPLLHSVTAYLDDDARARDVIANRLPDLVRREQPPMLHVVVAVGSESDPPPDVGPGYRVTERVAYPGLSTVVRYTFTRN